ncbi:MAG: aminotransferase class I/II-fold pyridoxal phosphate-dependent enzyme [Synergistales bacterium]|nr:aminotransferase class I/II-fold pyridoxal phosphate-dependent enzyme [Synergistales bacterium]
MPYIAKRAREGKTGIFAQVDSWVREAAETRDDLVHLGIGSPNRMPASHILDELVTACRREGNYKYPFIHQALPRAIADWYSDRFGVRLDPDSEVLPLWGTQEGLSHLPLALMEHGDSCLLPDPGYPIYHYMPTVVDGEGIPFSLLESTGFMPDFDAIDAESARKARFLLLNYPNNPLGKVAPPEVLERAVAFCREHDLLLVYDNAYCELTYDGRRAPSVLQVEGAREWAVEFNSFSKTFNLAGMRVGFMVGNPAVVGALKQLKGNMDYGLFRPAQEAAVAALTNPKRDEVIAGVRQLYQDRRDAFIAAASEEGWEIEPPEGSMFIWARVPGSGDDVAFTSFCIREAGVAVTPGSGFGPSGRGYVRIALVEEIPTLRQAARRIGRALSSWERERSQAR